ncbi:oligosaccharide flippase family protein [Vibrio sp. DNB22_10_4]
MFAIGPVASALLGLVTLPLITWFFSQEDVGKISMLHVVVSFTTMMFCLGLDQSYVREYHEFDNKARLFRTAWLPGSLALTLVLSIVLLLSNTGLSRWLFEVDSFALSLATGVMMLAAFSSRFLSLILRMNERGFAYSLSQILPKIMVLSVIAIYVLTETEKTFSRLLYANVMGGVTILLVLAWNTKDTLKQALLEKIDFERLKEMLSFGLPLVFGAAAYWGLTATDKIMLRSLSTYEELGLYSVAISFSGVATILQSVFSTIWAPTVYKWASKGENLEKLQDVTNYMLFAIAILFSLAGMFSWLVTFVLPEQYAEVQWLLVACMGAPLLYTLSETTVVGIGISRKSSFSMLASVLAFLVNLLGNYLLVPELGAKGATISTCLAFYLFFILRTEFSSLLWRPIKRTKAYITTFFFVASSVVMALLGNSANFHFALYWLVVLILISFLSKAQMASAYQFLIKKLNS